MATRSLNKVQLIGNLTRDPELRYTPQGNAVCTFGMATNRSWTTESGDQKEAAEFHRIVSWNKLAELCAQLLFKGRKVFVEGRLQTRKWTGQDGMPRQTTEVVISEMLILDSRRAPEEPSDEPIPEEPEEMKEDVPVGEEEESPKTGQVKETSTKKTASGTRKAASRKTTQKSAKKDVKKGEVDAEDIPF